MALTFIPYGSGKREKTWEMSGGNKVICRYNYFYILANDCQIASNIKWYTVNAGDEKEITYEQVKQISPLEIPRLGIWERYALVILSVFLVIWGFLMDPNFNEWVANTIGGIMIIALLYFGGNYIAKKFRKSV